MITKYIVFKADPDENQFHLVDYTTLLDVLDDEYAATKSQGAILKVYINWLNYEFHKRSPFFLELLKRINFRFVSCRDIKEIFDQNKRLFEIDDVAVYIFKTLFKRGFSINPNSKPTEILMLCDDEEEECSVFNYNLCSNTFSKLSTLTNSFYMSNYADSSGIEVLDDNLLIFCDAPDFGLLQYDFMTRETSESYKGFKYPYEFSTSKINAPKMICGTTTAAATWYDSYKAMLTKQEETIATLELSKDEKKNPVLSLDTSLKKTTVFSNKLKHLSGSATIDALTLELDKVNVSKFLDEIIDAIMGCRLKASDIHSMVLFCAKASSYYKDFAPLLYDAMKRSYPYKKNDKIKEPKKLRVDIQFLLDLLLFGVLGKEGLTLFGSVISFVINSDLVEFNNLGIILAVFKGNVLDVTTFVPMKLQNAAIVVDKVSNVFNEDQKKVVSKLVMDYYNHFVRDMEDKRQELLKLERNIKRLEKTRGDCSAEERSTYESKKEIYGAKIPLYLEFCEIFGKAYKQQMLVYEDTNVEDEMEFQIACDINSTKMSLWKDPDLKMFYENLLDVRQSLGLIDTIGTEGGHVELQTSIDAVELDIVDTESNVGDSEVFEPNDGEHDEVEEDTLEDQITKLTQYEDEENDRGEKVNFGELMRSLMRSINKTLIDETTMMYLSNFNDKKYSKRLTSFILEILLERNDVLPFVARFLANIKNYNEPLVSDILKVLLGGFDNNIYTAKCDRTVYRKNLRRVQHAKLLSELVKFKVVPKAEGLACFRKMLVNLRGINGDIFAAMVDSCGGFLYRNPDSYAKMFTIIELAKKKIENSKDERVKTLIENAIYNVLPDAESGSVEEIKFIPTVEGYINKCFHDYIEKKINHFKGMDLNDPEFKGPLIKFLSTPENVSFENSSYLAEILKSFIDRGYDWCEHYVIDLVFERLEQLLERNIILQKQCLISNINYIGDLFSFSLVSRNCLLNLLYKLLPATIIQKPIQWDITCLRFQIAASLCIGVKESFIKREFKLKLALYCEYLAYLYATGRDLYHAEFDAQIPWTLRNTIQDFNSSVRKHGNIEDSVEVIKGKFEKLQNILKKSFDKAETKVDIMGGIKEEDEEENPNQIQTKEDSGEESDGDSEKEDDEPHNARNETCEDSLPILEEEEHSNDYCEVESEFDEEDDLFNSCLDSMLSKEPSDGVSFKPINVDFAIPSSARQKLERINQDHGKLVVNETTPTDVFQMPSKDDGSQAISQSLTVSFLTKAKSSKPILKKISIDDYDTTTLRERMTTNTAKNIKEKKEIKKLTLRFNQQQVEEEMQESND
uniref:MIF4G domain-containing protein n=1 Tax=Rhabditophanes sp. KR3021 TaxID=114890 RepID=A0AC35UD38_9BILA